MNNINRFTWAFMNVAAFKKISRASTFVTAMVCRYSWYPCFRMKSSSTGLVTAAYVPFGPFTINYSD